MTKAQKLGFEVLKLFPQIIVALFSTLLFGYLYYLIKLCWHIRHNLQLPFTYWTEKWVALLKLTVCCALNSLFNFHDVDKFLSFPFYMYPYQQ